MTASLHPPQIRHRTIAKGPVVIGGVGLRREPAGERTPRQEQQTGCGAREERANVAVATKA